MIFPCHVNFKVNKLVLICLHTFTPIVNPIFHPVARGMCDVWWCIPNLLWVIPWSSNREFLDVNTSPELVLAKHWTMVLLNSICKLFSRSTPTLPSRSNPCTKLLDWYSCINDPFNDHTISTTKAATKDDRTTQVNLASPPKLATTDDCKISAYTRDVYCEYIALVLTNRVK